MGQDKGDKVREWKRSVKEVRRVKRRVRSYVEYILDLLGDLDDSGDLIEQVREGLKRISEEGELLPTVITVSGESFEASDILRFLEKAPHWQVELFRDILKRELDRRRKLWEEIRRLVEAVEGYSKKLGVYVPFDVVEYDRRCFGDGECIFLFKVKIGGKTYMDEYEGTFEGLVELFKGAVRSEVKRVSKLVSRAREARAAFLKEVEGLESFLREIESHVIEDAIVYFTAPKLARPRSWGSLPDELIELKGLGLRRLGGSLEVISWDIKRIKGGEVLYGAHPELWSEFYSWLVETLKNLEKGGSLAVNLRSFRKEVDEATGLPVKELRAYMVRLEGGRVVYQQLSAREVMEAYTRDPTTGKRLKPEPAVVYCGPGDEKIYSASLELE